VGYHPQYYQRYLDLYKSDVLFYSATPENLFPEAFQKELLKHADFKVRFVSTDPEAAEILLVNQDYFKNKKTSGLKIRAQEKSDWEKLFQMVSPDFQRDIFKDNWAIPLLWKVDNGKLIVLSLTIESDGYRAHEIWKFVSHMMSDPIYSSWLGYHQWNTTLYKFDEGPLSENRKAGAIRKFDLDKIGLNN